MGIYPLLMKNNAYIDHMSNNIYYWTNLDIIEHNKGKKQRERQDEAFSDI
jgi:hypothetical protein